MTFWLQEITQSFHSKNIYEEETEGEEPSRRATHRSKSSTSSSSSSSSSASTKSDSTAFASAASMDVSHDRIGSESPRPSSNSSSAVTPDTQETRIHSSHSTATHVASVVYEEKMIISVPIPMSLTEEQQRIRSSSISETDCEESLSPEVPSYDNGEFSIPSPLSLPPTGTDCAAHFLAMDEAMKLRNAVNVINDERMEICVSTVPMMKNNNSDLESRSMPKNLVYMNKPTFSAIPNPVKVFLPRHYSSQSCPTFSPFQTSSFSPFKTNNLKPPVVPDQNGWKNYFSSEKNFI